MVTSTFKTKQLKGYQKMNEAVQNLMVAFNALTQRVLTLEEHVLTLEEHVLTLENIIRQMQLDEINLRR